MFFFSKEPFLRFRTSFGQTLFWSLPVILSLIMFSGQAVVAQEDEAEEGNEQDQEQEEEVPNYWSGAIDAGYSIARGNSRLEDIFLQGELLYEREDFSNEMLAEYRYAREDGDTTQDRGNLGNQMNWDVSERTFVWNFSRIGYDRPSSIRVYFQQGLGLGYHFYQEEDLSLIGEAGPAFRYEDRLEGEDVRAPSLRLSEKYRHQITETLQLRQSLSVFPDLEDTGEFLAEARAEFRVRIYENLNMKFILSDRYDSDPAPDTEENDFEAITTFGYQF